MSLILEALKKVERERATPEQRGFLVLGPAAWAPARSNAGWILGMIGAAVGAGVAVYITTRPDPAPRARPAVTEDRPSSPAAVAPAREVPPPAAADWGPPPQAALPPVRPTVSAGGSAPVPAQEPSAPVLTLHAISVQDGVPIAVVNHRVVREGDRFDGVRVVRIGAAEVEIETAGVRRVLRF